MATTTVTASGTDYIALINALAPLITNLAPLVAQAINMVQAQGGKDVDTILAETGVQIAANDALILANMAAEQKAIEGGAA
jgi:hypothetical protein